MESRFWGRRIGGICGVFLGQRKPIRAVVIEPTCLAGDLLFVYLVVCLLACLFAAGRVST